MRRAWRATGLCLFVLTGCGKFDLFGRKPEAPSKAGVDDPSFARPTKGGASKNRPTTIDVAPEKPWTPPAPHARGSLFARLPKGTLLALRLPEVSRLAEAFGRTSLRSLMDSPLIAQQRDQFEQMLLQARANLLPRLKDNDELLAQVRKLKGELVVAVPTLDFAGLAAGSKPGSGPGVTVAALYQAGASAEAFQTLLDRVFELSKSEDGQGGLEVELPLVTPGAKSWLRRRVEGKCSVAFARDGDLFTLTITTVPAALASSQALCKLPLDDSFDAADVVRATPDAAAEGSKPVAEFFLNLAPLWSVVALALPPDAKEPLANSGVTSIGGISLTSALGAKGLDESCLFLSPGGRDLLSRFCSSKRLTAALTRWLPTEFSDANIVSLDFAGLFDGIRGLLPLAARRGFDDGLAQMRRETGIDLRADLFGNIGPTFVVGARGSVDAAAAGGDFEWICAIELQDAKRARSVLDRLLKESGLAAAIHAESIEGYDAASTELPPLTTPYGQQLLLTPAWLVDDHALVLASKPATLRKAAVALKEKKGPAPIDIALEAAGEEAFAISTRRAEAESVATVGRRSPAGLTIATHDGNGALTSGAVIWGASIGASVALPKLLETRIASNENVAVETLRAICQAEAKMRASTLLDLDNDGHGEFGTLAELAGSVAMRGRTAPAPTLDASFAPDATGVLLRGGYRFRVDLPTKTGAGVATIDPNAPAVVSNDLAEQQFVAYAWPADLPGVGTRAFVIDPAGAVFFTKNDGDLQRYGGPHEPKFDAAMLRDANDRVKGVTAVRRGRDGGIWLEYR